MPREPESLRFQLAMGHALDIRGLLYPIANPALPNECHAHAFSEGETVAALLARD
jgi:hypothetical protein